MAKLVLFAVIAVVVLAVFKPLRRIVFHLHVRRFFLIFFTVTFIAALAIAGYFLWKYWWPIFMAKPTAEWSDTTIELNENPDTPGTGGPAQPVIIQTR